MPLLGKGLVYRIGYKLPQVNIEMTNNLIIFTAIYERVNKFGNGLVGAELALQFEEALRWH